MKVKKKGGNKPAFNVTSPLTRREYHREERAAERDALRPQARELKGEVRAERKQRSRIKDYFRQYGKGVEKSAAQTAAAYQDALSKTTSDAPPSLAGYTPSAAGTQAAASRTDSAALMRGVTASQGATQAAYLADKKRIGKGEKVNQLLLSHARSRSLSSDKRDLAQSRKDFRTDYRSRARETETAKIQNAQQLASTRRGQKATLRVAKQYGKNQAAHDAATLGNQLKVTHAQGKAKKREQRRSAAIVNSQGKGSKGDKGGIGLSQAMAWARSDHNAKSAAEAVDNLINRGVKPSVARKAVARVQRLHASTATQQALHGT